MGDQDHNFKLLEQNLLAAEGDINNTAPEYYHTCQEFIDDHGAASGQGSLPHHQVSWSGFCQLLGLQQVHDKGITASHLHSSASQHQNVKLRLKCLKGGNSELQIMKDFRITTMEQCRGCVLCLDWTGEQDQSNCTSQVKEKPWTVNECGRKHNLLLDGSTSLVWNVVRNLSMPPTRAPSASISSWLTSQSHLGEQEHL